MSKLISALFLTAGFAFIFPQAAAETAPSTKQASKNKVSKKTTKEEPASDKEGEAVDISGLSSTHYSCEQGNKLTILKTSNDDKQITVRWRDKLHTLLRVNTTTGANRYEGPMSGLVWIGIPSKGMLLDSHKGHQLANECKDAQQLKHST